GELGKLHALTKKIRKGLKKEKIWFDKKPFIGHATLARIKKSQDLKNLVGKVKVKRVKFMADEVTFYQSQLTEAGPIYEKIKVIKINAN
ncbi:MAG: hypothetical protein GTO66_27595, partial [Candidatus Aminicenantes bacterium]|nr:hypothetical protein [Candidatus Aminicenantes bacterium]